MMWNPWDGGKLQLTTKEEEELAAAVKFGSQESISQVITQLSACMKDAKVHDRQYQVYMISVTNCLIS